MRILICLLASFQLFAGVHVKELNYKLYNKWVTPELQEIIEAYQNIFSKIDKKFDEDLKHIPVRNDLIYLYNSLLNHCKKAEKFDLNECTEKIQSFKSTLSPYYSFWQKKFEQAEDKYKKSIFENLTKNLKPFLEIQAFKSPQKAKYPHKRKLMALYTIPYPYLISELKLDQKNDIERLWGNVMEPVISKLLHQYNLTYLKKHIDRMNLQINETRMIWTKRAEVDSDLQKSIRYIHYKWNIMLKSILKF